ncbi:MAG: alpha/beta hydrolase fold domain-containing protein [Pseudomonadota bacterium]
MAELTPPQDPAALDLAQMRALSSSAKAPFNARAAGRVSVREEVIAGRPTIIIAGRDAPPVVHLHGGGWSIGSARDHLSLLVGLHRASGRTVIAPHPRQAPEHPFPAPVDDVAAIMAAIAPRYGRVHLSGDSAGAHLAIHAALRGASLISLILAYGCLRRVFDTPSHKRFGDGTVGLSTNRMRAFWDWFDPEGASDLTRADLSSLPPAQLHAANVDVLRDDTLWLDQTLYGLGRSAELHMWPGMSHGFLHYSEELTTAQRAFQTMAAFMDQLDAY